MKILEVDALHVGNILVVDGLGPHFEQCQDGCLYSCAYGGRRNITNFVIVTNDDGVVDGDRTGFTGGREGLDSAVGPHILRVPINFDASAMTQFCPTLILSRPDFVTL